MIQVPSNIVDSDSFKLKLTGQDASNNVIQLTDSLTLPITVVSRADLEFSARVTSPISAADGIVSINQQFTVSAFLKNNGIANVVGADSIAIEIPAGYRLVNQDDPLTKSSLGQNNASWQLIAPGTLTGNETISFELKQKPKDENTNDVAVVDAMKTGIVMATEIKTLLVEAVSRDGSQPAAQGQTGVSVLDLNLSHASDGQNVGNISLQQISFRVRARDAAGNERDINPNLIFKSIRLAATQDTSNVYGSVAPGINNPVSILIDTLQVPSGDATSVTLLADMTASSAIQSFRIVFENSSHFSALDDDSDEPVAVIDSEGRTGADFSLRSDLAVLFAPQLSSFGNYPNPFKPTAPGAAEGTRFIYFLAQASNVELQIFTLLGELVWKKNYTAADPQGQQGGHSGDIVWNGYNDDGNGVLNGVYLAVMKTNSGIATAKIAVVK